MAATSVSMSTVRGSMASCLGEAVKTVLEAGLCAEIAILTVTCFYLYLHNQSTIVVLAFLLIALDRRTQDAARRRSACCRPAAPRGPEAES